MSRCMIVFLVAVGVYAIGMAITELVERSRNRKEGKQHG